jgi:PKD repeat protein
VAALLVGLAVGLGNLQSAHASNSFLVNFIADAGGDANPGNGVCSTAFPGRCTLRAAIQESNALPGHDEIRLPAGCTFRLTLSGPDEDSARTGDLDITDDLTITRYNAYSEIPATCADPTGIINPIIDGAGLDRALHIMEDLELKLINVDITNGNSVSRGGGIRIDSGAEVILESSSIYENTALEEGGGIVNYGSLTLIGSMIFDNEAAVNGGGISVRGGSLIVRGSQITGNQALVGGGIHNGHWSSAEIRNEGNTPSVISENVALEGGGGGIDNDGSLFLAKSTVSDNVAFYGGGIQNSNHMEITDSIISGNVATANGGGIENYLGNLLIIDSTLQTNHTDNRGGAISNEYGTVTISESTLYKNSADYGGAIYNRHPWDDSPHETIVVISLSTIDSNAASSNGGGIFNLGAVLEISDSTVRANVASTDGGGIFEFTGSMEIFHSTFHNNTSNSEGGAIYTNQGSANIIASEFYENSADTGGAIQGRCGPRDALIYIGESAIYNNYASGAGGGINNVSCSLEMINSTVSGNACPQNTGGIYILSTWPATFMNLNNVTITNNTSDDEAGIMVWGDQSITISNTIIAGNTDRNGQIYDCVGRHIISEGHNLIQVASPPPGYAFCSITGDTSSNIIGQDPLLGPLQDNGGLALTHALLGGSPAIDAGNPAAPGSGSGTCEPGSQNAISRPQGLACDIGAFELLPNTLVGTNVVVQPEDSIAGTTPVTVTFDQVTQEGTTSLTMSDTGPTPDSGFKLGDPPIYYQLETTAGKTGNMEICIDYNGIAFSTTPPILQHYVGGTGWVELAATFPSPNVICGIVTDLSYFALFETFNLPPMADAGGPYAVSEGGSVGLAGSGSDPNGDPLTFMWDLDDNGAFETSGQNATFSASGLDGPSTRTVVLQACDAQDACATNAVIVTVNNVPPVVQAGADQTVAESEPVSFAGSFTDAGSADTHTIEWNFGDGMTTDGTQTPSHAYAESGSYTVTLTVIDDDGGVDSDTLTVVVSSVAIAVEAGADQAVDEGAPVHFSGSFTDPRGGEAHNIEWDFGDGAKTDGTLTPTHVYADDGTYIVTLTVTDDDGGAGSDTLTITVDIRAAIPEEGEDKVIDKNAPGLGDSDAPLPITGQGLTDRDAWVSTIIFGVLGLAAAIPLILLFKRELFERDWRTIGLGSAIFWGVFGMAMIFGFWKIYYSLFYPGWVRWLTPLTILLYSGLGLGMWWLATKLPGPPALWFVLLGGVEGIAEHVFGIYVLRILEKVPFLQGITPFPAITFSFFEYIFYWAIAGWIAYAFARWWG